MYIYIYICSYLFIYLSLSLSLSISLSLYIYIYIYHTHIYIYIYTYTYSYGRPASSRGWVLRSWSRDPRHHICLNHNNNNNSNSNSSNNNNNRVGILVAMFHTGVWLYCTFTSYDFRQVNVLICIKPIIMLPEGLIQCVCLTSMFFCWRYSWWAYCKQNL